MHEGHSCQLGRCPETLASPGKAVKVPSLCSHRHRGGPAARLSERCGQWAWVSGSWQLSYTRPFSLGFPSCCSYPIGDTAPVGLADDSVTSSARDHRLLVASVMGRQTVPPAPPAVLTRWR